jgi:hypothetical protein
MAGTTPRNDVARHLFTSGNYTGLIALGRDDLWEHHAALGLIGRTDDAIDGLRRFDGPAPRFHEAAALWIAGDETGAVALLSSVVGISFPWQAHARSLLTLLRKPQITVLSLLPSPSSGPHVLLASGTLDGKFDLTNVGYTGTDRPNTPYASAHRLWQGQEPPDFALCEMVEWHQIPPDLDTLPCPLLGQTADYDMHIQAVLPWLRMFDEIIVTDHTEHAGVGPLVTVPVTTIPKTFAHPIQLPRPRRRERDIDIFVSGTLFSPWHPDKAALLHQILGLPDVRVAGFNGFIPNETYYDLLSRSRLSVSYYRRPGGMVTRGIEAACMGCVTLVQEGSVLPLYAGSDHGLVSYSASPDGLAQTVRHVLAHYDHYEARAWRAVPRLRQALAPDVVASHYLRLCTVLATRPRPSRRTPTPSPVDRAQKRVFFWKGWQPGGGLEQAAEALETANITHWRQRLAQTPDSNGQAAGRMANDLAREMLIGLATRLMAVREHDPIPGSDPIPSESSIAVLRDELFALQAHWTKLRPHDLVLRFNHLRARLHFGTATDAVTAMQDIEAALAVPETEWIIAPEDDVLPYDLFDRFFNYRAYLDHVVAAFSEAHGPSDVSRAALIRLIRASLYHYLARTSGNGAFGLDYACEAVRLDPNFPFYQLDLAKRLAILTGSQERKAAITLLTGLSNRSLVAVEAQDVLIRLMAEQNEGPLPSQPSLNAARIGHSMIDAEGYLARLSSPYHRCQQLSRNGWRGPKSVRIAPSDTTPVLSVVLVDRAQRDCSILRAALARQTIDRSSYERIFVDLYDEIHEFAARDTDHVIACCQTDIIPHVNRGLNAGLLASRGKVSVLIAGVLPLSEHPVDSILPVDFLEGALRLSDMERTGHVLFHRFPNGGGALAGQTTELLASWGLDEHEAFQGHADGLADFASRLRALGVTVEETTPGSPTAETLEELNTLRHALWPILKQKGRSNPLLGNFLVTQRNDKISMEGDGLNIFRKSKQTILADSLNEGEGFIVSLNAIPGYVLEEKHIPLPSGTYRLVVTGQAWDILNPHKPVLGMEIVQDGNKVLLSGGLTATSLPDGAAVTFHIPNLVYRPDGGVGFRFVHLGNATVRVDAMRLHLLSESTEGDLH